MSSKKDGKGTGELNKHDSSLNSEDTKFHEEEGVTFSVLLKVIYTVLSIFLFEELVLVSAVQWLFIIGRGFRGEFELQNKRQEED